MEPRLLSNNNEKIIKEVFYNALVESVLDSGSLTQENLNQKLFAAIVTTTRNMLEQSKQCEGIQLFPGMVITLRNCPEKYREFFTQLINLKNREPTHHELVQFANQIIQLKSFAEINPTQFLLEAIGQVKPVLHNIESDITEITPDLIRQTFYNEMVTQTLFALHKEWLTLDELEEKSGRIFLVMPALTLLEAIQQSLHYEGIRLLNNKILTLQNCPPVENFPAFTKLLLSIKEKINVLSANQLDVVKHVLSSEKDLPNDLQASKTPELMQLVAVINDVSIEISRAKYFRNMINDVMTFCCDIFKKEHVEGSLNPIGKNF